MAMNFYTKYLPRWFNHWFAELFGYYWLSCHRCGKFHGGHEFEWPEQSLIRDGYANCPWCREAGSPYTWKPEKKPLWAGIIDN